MRIERKYLVSQALAEILKQRMGFMAQPDPHGLLGSYSVFTTYYDSTQRHLATEKLDGNYAHLKLRRRSYLTQGAPISFTEAKIKCDQRQFKIRYPSDGGFWVFEDVEILSTCGWPGLARGGFVASVTPACHVRFERAAFSIPGTGVRFNFDSNLQALFPNEALDLSQAPEGCSVIPGRVVFEIKSSDWELPEWVERELKGLVGGAVTFSKYIEALNALESLKGDHHGVESAGQPLHG